MKNVNDFLLTTNVSVGALRDWMRSKDNASKTKIIELINHRFTNRYIKHVKEIRSGFLKMAISCLMIETLESFRQGRKNTKKKGVGKKMFKDFFKTESDLFPGFQSIASEFYSSIRCGILHQAETTNAWRIVMKDGLLDTKEKTINATKFVSALEKALQRYIASLESNELDDRLWKNALLKLDDICNNCNSSTK